MSAARVCLQCRRVLEPGEACEPGHVASADRHEIRATARTPPPTVKATGVRRTKLRLAGLLGLVAAAAVAPFSLDDAAVLAIAGAGTLIHTFVSRTPQIAATRNRGRVARVDVPDSLVAPLTGRRCAAWAYTALRGGAVLCRDGRGALAVRFPDGSRVEVPACAIVGRRDRDVDALTLGSYLERKLPGAAPLSCDGGYEDVIEEGDWVEIEGELEPHLDRDAADERGYRDAPATVLRPRGRVVLHRVDPPADDFQARSARRS